jgi:hypothetical protein
MKLSANTGATHLKPQTRVVHAPQATSLRREQLEGFEVDLDRGVSVLICETVVSSERVNNFAFFKRILLYKVVVVVVAASAVAEW